MVFAVLAVRRLNLTSGNSMVSSLQAKRLLGARQDCQSRCTVVEQLRLSRAERHRLDPILHHSRTGYQVSRTLPSLKSKFELITHNSHAKLRGKEGLILCYSIVTIDPCSSHFIDSNPVQASV